MKGKEKKRLTRAQVEKASPVPTVSALVPPVAELRPYTIFLLAPSVKTAKIERA